VAEKNKRLLCEKRLRIEMNQEQISTLVFLAGGLLAGTLSSFIKIVFLTALAGFGLFAIIFYFYAKFFPPKKYVRFLFECFLTYSLVWLTVWVFLFNLR
jgi:hypothetical protein